jgi:hypothetical protein
LVEVESHSWVACADYRITSERDSFYYNDEACHGYARNFKEYDRGFGVDAGYDYSLPADGEVLNACPQRAPRTNPISASYTDRYPMPNYTPGQEVCMAWPSKNHVAGKNYTFTSSSSSSRSSRVTLCLPFLFTAPCLNQFIPDGGVKIFMSTANPTVDPPQSGFESNLIAEMPKHQDKG